MSILEEKKLMHGVFWKGTQKERREATEKKKFMTFNVVSFCEREQVWKGL